MRIRRQLGKWMRGLLNWLDERGRGPDTRFVYDYETLEDYMRVSFCSVREVGFQTRCMISERIVEYPLVFQKITKRGSRILDVGSAESFLPYQLASLGHRVVASDLFPPNQQWHKHASRNHWTVREDWGGYLFKHPGLHFVREDATRLAHADNSFDYVTAISTVEHFGCYGVRVADPTAIGLRAMTDVRRVLKPGGTLLLSVPYGVGGESPRNWLLQLVFNADLLGTYLQNYEIADRKFYLYREYCWTECGESEAAKADCATRTTGMCFVEARKN